MLICGFSKFVADHHHHHHKHHASDPLIRSVSTLTGAVFNVSSVFQLFSFLVVCSDMISKGFGFVAYISENSEYHSKNVIALCTWALIRL